ncbi:MAG: dihydrodipicolinate synthase family protein [Chloroflexota bacterium]
MKYRKSEAKEWAREHWKGVWVASYTPYTPDYKIDEKAWRQDLRYLIDDLEIQGMFVDGLMGEGFHQTIAERKRMFDIAVEEAKDDMITMPYTSDPVLENVLDMTRYAENIGADLAIIINPKFYFGAMSEEGIYQYYKYVADRVNIGIAIFNQMEHGYLISPKLVSRIAGIENIVGIKNIAPPDQLRQTRMLCGDKIVVVADEEDWLVNYINNGGQAMLPSPYPYCLQSKSLKLVKEYITLAVKGDIAGAWAAYQRMEPIRRALQKVTVPGKRQATYKYWSQQLGMAGGDGRVRLPQMELTDAEKRAIKEAIESTELVKEVATASRKA